MRLVSGFESVLDPLVATLDNLPEHFDAAYAPRDVLELLSDWLALERDELRSGEERRRIVRASAGAHAAARDAGRGSSSRSSSPSRTFRSGSRTPGAVRWSLDPDADWKDAPPSFVVYCDMPLARGQARRGGAPDRAGQAGARRLPAARAGGGRAAEGEAGVRICPTCGRENPDDADFCVCGEYLRWEPTNHVRAVAAPAPPRRAAVADRAETVEAPARPSAPRWPTRARHAPRPPRCPSAARGSGGGRRRAALTLRLPDGESASGEPVAVEVEPGARVTILGLIRNQSEVVDNFDLSVRGLPEGWWTVTPATAYLVPYGTSGTYEQEIEIHLHPPRAPEAHARAWSFEVVAISRAHGSQAATAPASVDVRPYFDIATELRPERRSGRLKARYTLTVRNRANARTEVAVSAEDTDGECQFRFAQPSVAIEPGNAIACPFTCLPPRQVWLGRTLERRFQVLATPIGVAAAPPQPPRVGVFRQKPWLPWWLALVVPVAVALAVAARLAPAQAGHGSEPEGRGQRVRRPEAGEQRRLSAGAAHEHDRRPDQAAGDDRRPEPSRRARRPSAGRS